MNRHWDVTSCVCVSVVVVEVVVVGNGGRDANIFIYVGGRGGSYVYGVRSMCVYGDR